MILGRAQVCCSLFQGAAPNVRAQKWFKHFFLAVFDIGLNPARGMNLNCSHLNLSR